MLYNICPATRDNSDSLLRFTTVFLAGYDLPYLKTLPELPPTEANEFGNVRSPIRICSEQCDKRTFKALCNRCSSSKSRLNRTRIIQKKNISTNTVTNLKKKRYVLI